MHSAFEWRVFCFSSCQNVLSERDFPDGKPQAQCRMDSSQNWIDTKKSKQQRQPSLRYLFADCNIENVVNVKSSGRLISPSFENTYCWVNSQSLITYSTFFQASTRCDEVKSAFPIRRIARLISIFQFTYQQLSMILIFVYSLSSVVNWLCK